MIAKILILILIWPLINAYNIDLFKKSKKGWIRPDVNLINKRRHHISYQSTAKNYENLYEARNMTEAEFTRSSKSGIQAYRSALTLDWLAAEDNRQREIVAAFEVEKSGRRPLASECMSYAKPSAGKVARLLVELLKNLEGDEGPLLAEFIQSLINAKLLFETSSLEHEPDLDALVKTPAVMLGEPHSTFPRIVTLLWMIVTDPSSTKRNGWCPVKRISKYVQQTRPTDIARHMRRIQPVVARIRFILAEFIQTMTPANMYQSTTSAKTSSADSATMKQNLESLNTAQRAMKKVFIRQESTLEPLQIQVHEHVLPTTAEIPLPDDVGLIHEESPFINNCGCKIVYKYLMVVFVMAIKLLI